MPRRFQQSLPFPAPPGLVCADGRAEPTLWIRRVVLWSDVSREPIRDIELTRGLNIVWSPVGPDPDTPATGHAAGKTLFCRLIRYCLGEDSFADPEDTVAIRSHFPNGAVGAEVRLNEETWVVRRRFGTPRDDRALNSEGLDQLADDSLRGTFSRFLEEIEGALFAEAQRGLLAEMEDVEEAWQCVLAWLTRDQECRIDGLTNWRHKASSSQSPVRGASAETRLNVLRVATGLYSTNSSSVRKAIARATNRANEAKSTVRKAESRFEALRHELAVALTVDASHIWPPPTEILQDEQQARDAHLDSLVSLADEKIRTVGTVSIDHSSAHAEEQLEQAMAELGRVISETSKVQSEIERKRELAKLLELDSAKRWATAREAKHPTCPYDGTPLDVERAKFVCPLPRLPDPADATRIAAETDDARAKALADLGDNESKLIALSGRNASLNARVSALRRKMDVQQLAVTAVTKASQTAWAAKGMVRRLFDLRTEADEALSRDAEAAQGIQDLLEQQKVGLSEFSTMKLERWFDFLVRRVVAPEANGTVVLDGNGLHPRIEWRGTRRSVALNSLRVVLFDLAAMLCAAEGDSPAPAFMIHDSPREGDLDPWTYSRLFNATRELGADAQNAPFQYIITTTTDPPENVRDRVRLQLGSDSEENRLFLVDL